MHEIFLSRKFHWTPHLYPEKKIVFTPLEVVRYSFCQARTKGVPAKGSAFPETIELKNEPQKKYV